jgi:hypothetical protein
MNVPVHEAEKNTQEENLDLAVMIQFMQALRKAQIVVHKRNKKWWTNIETGEPIIRNVGELLMLSVSELSEAMEGHRKNLMDDKLTNRPMFEVEIADCMIRLMDLSEGLSYKGHVSYDVPGAWYEKMQYNYTRVDHTIEHRLSENGKKY